jgi:superfamily II DNA or RNA helicase
MFRYKTDRVKVVTEVTTWTQEGDYFLFPRGDLGKLDRTFRDIPIQDMRVHPPLGFQLEMKPDRVLRPEQQEVAKRWLSCGYGIVQAPTGWGKCTYYKTLIFTSSGLRPVHEIVKQREDDRVEPIEGLSVVASEGYNQPISHTYYQARKPTLRMQTNLGYEVTGTYVHPLLVIDPELGLMWKKLADVTTRDYVAVRSAPICGEPPKLSGLECFSVQHPSETRLTPPEVFTPDLAELFGALTADGTVRAIQHSYTKTDPVLAARVRSALTALGMHMSTSENRKHQFASAAFGRFAAYSGLSMETAPHKEVPWIVRTSGPDVARAFLRGYFSGDGGVDTNKRTIDCTSASRELIHVVQIMLLSFGIPSAIRVKPVVPPGHTEPRDYYVLTLYRQHLPIFDREIGFVPGCTKDLSLKAVISQNAETVKTASSAQQLVRLPVNQWMRRLYDRYRTAESPGLRSLNLEQCLGKRATPPDISQLRNFCDHFLGDCDDSRTLRAILDYACIDGVYFLPVQSVTDAGEQEVFDLCVPDTHWFVGNGVVNHNTVVMAYLLSKMGMRTLVLADKVRHLQVVEEGLREHTNLDEVEKELGTAVCGELGTQVRFKPNGERYTIDKPGMVYPITLSTYQSLTSKNGKALLPHLRDQFGVVWHEESHHEAAETFHAVTKSFNPYYRGGQTATPQRGDKLHIVMFDTIGPVTALAQVETMTPRVQFIHTGLVVPDWCFRGQYAMPTVESFLAKDREYFNHIVECICEDLANDRKVLVFSKRKALNQKLKQAVHMRGYEVEVIDGNTKKVKEQSWYAQQMQDGKLNCIIGTQVIQENFNIPPLDCLHLPFTNFTEGLERQIVGRVLRSNVANKPQPLVRVYTWESTQKMAQTAVHWRRKLYSKLGYDFDQDRNLGPTLRDDLMNFG